MNKIFFCGDAWLCVDALENFLYEKHETHTVGGFLIGQSFVDYKILAPIKNLIKKFILPSKRFFKGYPMASLFDIDKDDIIVVAIPDNTHLLKIHPKALEISKKFIDLGYKKTYIYHYLYFRWENSKYDFLQKHCTIPNKKDNSILPHIEMNVTDWCNLNCKACNHYSPLFEHSFPKLEDRISDIKKLKDKFLHIESFALLGGEPFLNPELDKYIIQTREILPTTYINIVTNGLLLPKVDKKIFEVIRKNGIFIEISEYEPTYKMKATIEECLKQNNIKYNFSGYDKKEKFNMSLSLSKNSKYEKFCLASNCMSICNGKIAKCAPLLFIDKLNETFGTSLPTAGIIDLNSDISGKELLEELNKEVPLCKHCIKNPVDWEVCGKNPKLEDFAVND